MNKFQNLLKKKNLNLIIINSISLIIIILIFFLSNKNNNLINTFKHDCIINNKEDVYTCYKENRYVEVSLNKVFQTEVNYEEDGVVKAYYMDINLDDYGLIAIVSKNIGDEILDDNKKVLKGYLEKFTGSDKEKYNEVIDKYVEKVLKEYPELSEEDIRSTYLDIQLNSYSFSKKSNYFLAAIFIIVGMINIFLIVKGIRGIINPSKIKLSKHEKFHLIEKDYETGEIEYKSKNVLITKKYVYSFFLTGIKVIPIKDIIWAYYYVKKEYNVKIGKLIAILTKDRKRYILNDKKESIFNTLFNLNDKIILGFTKDNLKLYNEKTKKKNKKK